MKENEIKNIDWNNHPPKSIELIIEGVNEKILLDNQFIDLSLNLYSKLKTTLQKNLPRIGFREKESDEWMIYKLCQNSYEALTFDTGQKESKIAYYLVHED